jgi:hypothetical protein
LGTQCPVKLKLHALAPSKAKLELWDSVHL